MKQLTPIALTILAFTGMVVAAESRASIVTETELRYYDPTKTFEGYTLFGSKGKTYLIDMNGKVSHTWTKNGTNPRLLPNGNLLDVTNQGKTFVELDWDGNTIWTYTESRVGYAPHHDFTRIYNKKLGEYTTLIIANKSYTEAECAAVGADPTTGPYTGAQLDVISEIDSKGKVIWEWAFYDHLVQDVDAAKSNYVGTGKTIADWPGKLDANLPGRPIRKDWLHCNSLDFNPNLGQIVINSVQGEFYVIDHDNTFIAGDSAGSVNLAKTTTGDFLYRFGDPARYEQGLAPTISTDWTKSSTGHKQIGGAHHIQWIEDGLTGAGHFLVFNNGEYLFENTPQSYIFEIDGYRNSAGVTTTGYVNPPEAGYWIWESTNANQMKQKKNMSNQIVWKYSSLNPTNFYSTIGSSCQRLPNGNTLICAMNTGDIFEVTDSGEVVWEYINPVTEDGILSVIKDQYPCYNATFRAYRYGPDHVAFAGKVLTHEKTIVELANAGSAVVPENKNTEIFTPAGASLLQPQISGAELTLAGTGTIPAKIRITNMQGRTLYNETALPGSSIDLSGISKGVYILNLNSSIQTLTQKISIR